VGGPGLDQCRREVPVHGGGVRGRWEEEQGEKRADAVASEGGPRRGRKLGGGEAKSYLKSQVPGGVTSRRAGCGIKKGLAYGSREGERG